MCDFEPATHLGVKLCIMYFLLGGSNTDYLTHQTKFHVGNATLNSSQTDFLQKAVSSGDIVIDNGGNPYTVTNEDNPYASGQYLQYSGCARKLFGANFSLVWIPISFFDQHVT